MTPEGVFADRSITAAAKLLYGALDLYADAGGNAEPSLAQLIEATGNLMTRRTARRCLAQLEDSGYIICTERRGQGEAARYNLPFAPSPAERAGAPHSTWRRPR
jgi:hypothetical protein